MADALDIDSARRNVGRDKRTNVPAAKSQEHPLALILRLVAVNGGGGNSGLREAAHDLVGAMLRAGEDEGALDLAAGQNPGERCRLGPATALRPDESSSCVT